MKYLFLFFTLSVMSCCGQKLKIDDCISNASTGFVCPTGTPLPFSASNGYQGASQDDYTKLLDYCLNRGDAGVVVPQFAYCTSNFVEGGLDCVSQFCVQNAGQDGLVCTSTGQFFIPYAASNNYIVVSPTDSITLENYCDLSLGK